MRFLRTAALAATLTLAAAPAAVAQAQTAQPASTRTLNDVSMPTQIEVGGRSLVLNGMALRKKFVVKVYVAGLYLPQPTTDADAIFAQDMPRRVVLHFVRGIDKGKMCDAMYEGLEKNTPDHGPELKAKFDRFCGMMQDIEKGGEFVFTYLPGQGTTITVPGKDAGVIEGKDFGDALFKSFIGPKPGPGEGFKKNLLGVKG
jgi:hypothetical protein